MRNSSLRVNIIHKLKSDQVAIALVATALGSTFRTIERYLESALLEDQNSKPYISAHKKLTTPACLIAIKEALKTASVTELIEQEVEQVN